MTRRWIGAAAMAAALLGCGEGPTRLSVVGDSALPRQALPTSDRATELAQNPVLLAARGEAQGRNPDDTPPTTAEEAVRRGQERAQKEDLLGAIALFKQAHQLDPKDRPALYFLTLGRLLLSKEVPDEKNHSTILLRAAESARKLRDVAGADASPKEKSIIAKALFIEAGELIRQNQADRAMASLTEAVDTGFADDKVMTEDADLKPLRDRPEFSRLVEKVKQSAKTAARERDAAMTAEMLPEVKAGLASFQPFPFRFELPGLDGKTVRLADFRGKVTIVDIWGTWCPPCQQEIPHFVALQEKYRDKGLAIVGINFEQVSKGKEKEAIGPFAKEAGINYTLVIGEEKLLDQIPDFSSFPTTLFIDREGRVRYKHVGYATFEVMEYIVKTLLDEAPKG